MPNTRVSQKVKDLLRKQSARLTFQTGERHTEAATIQAHFSDSRKLSRILVFLKKEYPEVHERIVELF